MKILMMALLFMPLMALTDELPDEVKAGNVDGVVWYYAQRQSFESSYSIITFPDEVMVGFGAISSQGSQRSSRPIFCFLGASKNSQSWRLAMPWKLSRSKGKSSVF